MTWALLIYLTFTIGAAQEEKVFESDTRYSYEDCVRTGEQIVAWLSQDFASVRAYCIPDDRKGVR